MSDYASITKEDIDDKFNEMQKITEENGLLDHMVRSVEEYLCKKLEIKHREKMLTLKKKIKNNPSYVLLPEEKDILSYKRTFFKIYKNYSNNLPVGRGSVYNFELGADLLYSKEGSPLMKYLAIAHELGHVLFHRCEPNSDMLNEKIFPETQASYFSKILMFYRSKQFKDPSYNDSRIFDNETILSIIKKIYPLYDEKLLPHRKS
jgi:Zn-dependent peptidase ImmA (M78 family)